MDQLAYLEKLHSNFNLFAIVLKFYILLNFYNNPLVNFINEQDKLISRQDLVKRFNIKSNKSSTKTLIFSKVLSLFFVSFPTNNLFT